MKLRFGKAEKSIFLKKTKGLTIVELSISLLLSGIIIGLAVLLYLNFNQNLRIKNKQNQESIDILQNLTRIKDRFYFSEIAYLENNQSIFLQDHDMSFSRLRINGNDIILENDTLSFEDLNISVTNNEVDLIETLRIGFRFTGDTTHIQFTKHYENEVIFNLKQQDHAHSGY